MNYREELEKLIIEKEGIMLTKEVEEHNIPRQYLSIFVKENKLERISQGVYIEPNEFPDEMYILQSRNSKIIYSHETSLYLHDLTDRDPIELSVTVPYGYNNSKLREKGNIYTVKKELHQMGTMGCTSLYGRDIKIYDRERTICDIVRNRNNMDIAVLNEGIRRYLNSKNKNIPLLLKYAKKLNVEKIIRNYVELFI